MKKKNTQNTMFIKAKKLHLSEKYTVEYNAILVVQYNDMFSAPVQLINWNQRWRARNKLNWIQTFRISKCYSIWNCCCIFCYSWSCFYFGFALSSIWYFYIMKFCPVRMWRSQFVVYKCVCHSHSMCLCVQSLDNLIHSILVNASLA